jgi:hypothetical protein
MITEFGGVLEIEYHLLLFPVYRQKLIKKVYASDSPRTHLFVIAFL